MKNKVVLKEYQDLIDRKIEYKEYEKIAWEYSKKMEKQGWINLPIEGGYMSPDCSTLYIYNRSPYYGELLQFSKNSEKEYKKICDDLVNSGDFIYREW